MTKMFFDKVLIITYGANSFGNAVLKRFLKIDVKEIRIFKRNKKNRKTREGIEKPSFAPPVTATQRHPVGP